MRMLQCWKRAVFVTVLFLACLQVFVTYCPQWICNSTSSSEQRASNYELPPVGSVEKRTGRPALHPKVQRNIFGKYRDNGWSVWNEDESLNELDVPFNVNGSDVLVFLHIQKTGGTAFGKHMVKSLVDPFTGNSSCICKVGAKKCKCYRPGSKSKEWLFSRFSTGWKCGLHADYTELTNCVDQVLDMKEGVPQKRRYFYMTLLRDPYRRYLSEFLHVQRGATWRNSKHWCGGRFALASEISPCFKGDTWEGCSLDEFLACPDNLATNRQTRMLADLQLVGCYNRRFMNEEDRAALMLSSAKENLRKLAFFGLVEEMEDTQFVFERTFGLRFFERLNGTYEARGENFTLTSEQRQKFMQQIALDVQLYAYAKNLFQQRVTWMRLHQEKPGSAF